MKGIIFDIEEFSVYDGPGIRTAVFFKGCPLRCKWCHNPEGLSFKPQRVRNPNGCVQCGKCGLICGNRENCTACGECVKVCPRHLIRIAGYEIEASDLAKELLKNKDILTASGGGITATGGEVLAQHEFLNELLIRLKGVHRAIETSGYASGFVFKSVLPNVELVMLDLKAMDNATHRKYTRVSNDLILSNLNILKKSGKPFIIRIPLIPGVNDSKENFIAVAKALEGSEGLRQVEILPYNRMAGAKYFMLGLTYDSGFDTEKTPKLPQDIFESYNIACRVL